MISTKNGDREEYWMKRMQEKYEKLYNSPKFQKEEGFHFTSRRPGGIFSNPTRNRLLGISRKSGKNRSKANFEYDVRETMKTALIDMQLFIETAEEKDIIRILRRETLAPIVDVLFSKSRREILREAKKANKPETEASDEIETKSKSPKRDQELVRKSIGEKAKVSQLFIESAFECLRANSKFLTSKQQQEITDAIELSKGLTLSLLPDSERDKFHWSNLRSDSY